MRMILFLAVCLLLISSPFLSTAQAREPEFKSMEDVMEQTIKARPMQRRIVEAQDVSSALRRGIVTMQSLGFYVEQVYLMDNVIKAIYGTNRKLVCAFKVFELPGEPGRMKIWFNLHYGLDVVLDSELYNTFFDLYLDTGEVTLVQEE